MLKAFFEPASVAVIGASANPDKLGCAVLGVLPEVRNLEALMVAELAKK